MTDSVIDRFTGNNRIYSNFYPVIVTFEGMGYPTVEHAYQASKSKEFFFRKLMAALPANKAGLAKERGNTIRLRSDWEEIKIEVMHNLLCKKFEQDPFKTRLLETGDSMIIEGNYWHDNTWGDCRCNNKSGDHPECLVTGENWLGRLIMDVRSQLIEKDHCYRRYS
jgi:ribA/ribD-fused uncharacterized protein